MTLMIEFTSPGAVFPSYNVDTRTLNSEQKSSMVTLVTAAVDDDDDDDDSAWHAATAAADAAASEMVAEVGALLTQLKHACDGVLGVAS